MSKNIYKEDINNIDTIFIEDIEMNDFYIDKDKVNSIKVPDDMYIWIKESIDKAEKEIKQSKMKKQLISSAASIMVILSIGVYNPVLAHKIPFLESTLQNINKSLKVDEISYRLGIDKIFPKAILDKNNKINFISKPNYTLSKIEEDGDKEISNVTEIKENNVQVPLTEYLEIQFIHKMSNYIIIPVDNRIYGSIEITPNTINIAIDSLNLLTNEEAKSYLEYELSKWKKGDFNNAVEVHNYVWNLLDGEVGKAISLKGYKIDEIIEKHFKN